MTSQAATGETLLPQTWTVTVGDETRSVRVFVVAKTIWLFTLLGQLLDKVSAANVIRSVFSEGTDEEAGVSLITTVMSVLPVALREGAPTAFKILGLIFISPQTLRQMEDAGEDVEARLLRDGRDIAYLCDTAQTVEIVRVGMAAIGTETIAGILPKLLSAFLPQK